MFSAPLICSRTYPDHDWWLVPVDGFSTWRNTSANSLWPKKFGMKPQENDSEPKESQIARAGESSIQMMKTELLGCLRMTFSEQLRHFNPTSRDAGNTSSSPFTRLLPTISSTSHLSVKLTIFVCFNGNPRPKSY